MWGISSLYVLKAHGELEMRMSRGRSGTELRMKLAVVAKPTRLQWRCAPLRYFGRLIMTRLHCFERISELTAVEPLRLNHCLSTIEGQRIQKNGGNAASNTHFVTVGRTIGWQNSSSSIYRNINLILLPFPSWNSVSIAGNYSGR